ncbi:pyroglutamyl-peptidase I [bacterium RCC_150]
MILLAGFEPFGGDSSNPSWAAVLLARDILRAEGLQVEARELPCVFGESASVLLGAIERLRPELVICAGLAGGRDRLSLERVAINCDDARISDNAGNRPVDQPVVPGGPAAYFSTLPLKPALQALQIAGIRAEVSQTAGSYLCNHVFYALMHALAAAPVPDAGENGVPAVRGGFIHVPYAEVQASQEAMASAAPATAFAAPATAFAAPATACAAPATASAAPATASAAPAPAPATAAPSRPAPARAMPLRDMAEGIAVVVRTSLSPNHASPAYLPMSAG